MEEKTARETALEWWENLSLLKRVLLIDKYAYLLGNVRRVNTLSEREIEKIYNLEHIV